VFAFSLFTGQAVGVAVCTQAVRLSGYTPAFIAVGVLLLLLSRWFAGRLRDR
jgi:hypothetical protein